MTGAGTWGSYRPGFGHTTEKILGSTRSGVKNDDGLINEQALTLHKAWRWLSQRAKHDITRSFKKFRKERCHVPHILNTCALHFYQVTKSIFVLYLVSTSSFWTLISYALWYLCVAILSCLNAHILQLQLPYITRHLKIKDNGSNLLSTIR